MKFKQENNLYQALEQTKNCMCNDKELPVRVEAAIALQMLISDQDKGKFSYFSSLSFSIVEVGMPISKHFIYFIHTVQGQACFHELLEGF